MSKYLVLGHKNPDTDSVGSAIAFADYLGQLGIAAEAVTLGTLNAETQYALEYFNFEAPRIVQTVANETSKVALVDHNEPQQSVDDLDQVRVDYVIDHHRIGAFETAHPLYYRCEPIGSTASILFKMFNEKQLKISKDIAGLMLSALISDTLLLKSPTHTAEDIEIAKALAEIAEVNLEDYGLEMLKAGTNLSARSTRDLLDGDAKSFQMNGENVRIGQVNAIGFDEALARKDDILAMMAEDVKAHAYDVFMLIITDILDSNSIAFISGESVQPITVAFKQEIIDEQIDLPGVVSRKTQIVPQLTKAFEA